MASRQNEILILQTERTLIRVLVYAREGARTLIRVLTVCREELALETDSGKLHAYDPRRAALATALEEARAAVQQRGPDGESKRERSQRLREAISKIDRAPRYAAQSKILQADVFAAIYREKCVFCFDRH